MKTYTVAIVHEGLQTGDWCGTFTTLEAARAFAQGEAARCRRSVTYQVCEGAPERPGRKVLGPLGGFYRGKW